MKQYQKEQTIKICIKWIFIFAMIVGIFFIYQKLLGNAYEREMISWIGQYQETNDIKSAIFFSENADYYSKGIEELQSAGYEETGKAYLQQKITDYGKNYFLLSILGVCTISALAEIIWERKKEKQIWGMFEKENEAEYEKIQSEKEFIQEERKKMGNYMENISHQLKTPITGTLLGLEYLLETEQNAQKKERIEGCVKQLSWMSDMTIVLLRLAQIDAGKIWMNRKKENLTNLIEECVERVEPFIEEKNIIFETELSEKCILSCDAFWIKEAIGNVLKNAIQFVPENGLIRISLKQIDGHYELIIFNGGKTLEPEYRERIFERFYQIDVNKAGGFGIGLHLSREIMRLHQGTLRVLDVNEDGTSFQFWFPIMIAKDNSEQNLSIL